jgi:hypothetical protein
VSGYRHFPHHFTTLFTTGTFYLFLRSFIVTRFLKNAQYSMEHAKRRIQEFVNDVDAFASTLLSHLVLLITKRNYAQSRGIFQRRSSRP